MNPRNLWRFLQRTISSFSVPDHLALARADRLVLFSCHDVDRAMRDDTGRYSPILEGIRSTIDELGYKTINLTHPYAVFRSAEVKGGTLTINYRSAMIRLRVLLNAWRGSSARARLRLDLEVQLYRSLLLRMSPQAILSIQPPASLCLAAKQLGIRVIEAMHGTNISLTNKLFCDHMQQPEDRLPDTIISFDEVSQHTVSTLCSGRGIVALKSRDPWLHLLRRQTQLGRAQNAERPPTEQSGKVILITLQWGYDGERDSLSNIIPNGILHPALEAVFASTVDSGIRFLLRMHPIQVNAPGYRHHRRHVKTLCARYPHIESRHATGAPLPLLLNEASGHITMCSSSAGEALVAGVPTLLLCPTLREGGANYGLFRELEASGLVRFGELDTNYIQAWIDRCSTRSGAQYNSLDIEDAHENEKSFYSALLRTSAA